MTAVVLLGRGIEISDADEALYRHVSRAHGVTLEDLAARVLHVWANIQRQKLDAAEPPPALVPVSPRRHNGSRCTYEQKAAIRELLGQGLLSNRAIAARVEVSRRTVIYYRDKIAREAENA